MQVIEAKPAEAPQVEPLDHSNHSHDTKSWFRRI
jgi:hypothetical protein